MTTKDDADLMLTAVSPIDGRYRARTRALERYFSEFALIRFRARVEIEWYLSLAENPRFDAFAPLASARVQKLRRIYEDFSLADGRRIKEIEAETNHDVKAVEYFLKEKLAAIDPELPGEMMHFACTSEDISNLAWALMLKEFATDELTPKLGRLLNTIAAMAHRYKLVPMVARTHGQAASPTTMGKELAVFAARLMRQIDHLGRQQYLGKFNGAVGNFNAHQAACPELDWIAHSQDFVERLGLVWNPLTTQIESHDFIAELFDMMVRIDTILLDFARDMWGYISLGYFRQQPVKGEVGSSTMPHKVNPIDFENAEGNLGLATALFQHLATKLPISRWQRDLSDSTAFRSFGTAFGHLTIALDSLARGLSRVELDQGRMAAGLDDPQAFEVLAEAIQTLMRRHGVPNSYEQLKELTRGRIIDRAAIEKFVAGLPLEAAARERLTRLTPRGYIGLAAELVDRFCPVADTGKDVNNRRRPG
ncbi:MAG: adenylosuccinate lyase [Candidatus Binataceae bacterium]|nr:adenylosuccinate lyase [Candidatus Binataceae bacterium]